MCGRAAQPLFTASSCTVLLSAHLRSSTLFDGVMTCFYAKWSHWLARRRQPTSGLGGKMLLSTTRRLKFEIDYACEQTRAGARSPLSRHEHRRRTNGPTLTSVRQMFSLVPGAASPSVEARRRSGVWSALGCTSPLLGGLIGNGSKLFGSSLRLVVALVLAVSVQAAKNVRKSFYYLRRCGFLFSINQLGEASRPWRLTSPDRQCFFGALLLNGCVESCLHFCLHLNSRPCRLAGRRQGRRAPRGEPRRRFRRLHCAS